MQEEIIFPDHDNMRDRHVITTVEKLFDSLVGDCPLKCDNGFIQKKHKLSDIKDLMYQPDEKCECRKKYEIYKPYIISGIPQEFWGMKDAELHIDTDSAGKIKLYLEKLDKIANKGFGILFTGGPEGLKNPNSGVGKTAVAIKILEHALLLNKTAHYITMHSYFNMIYRSKDEDGAYYRNLVDEIDAVDFLCIDEIGKINKTDYVYFRFEDTIRKRASQLLVTLLITNMNDNELEDYVGPSLMDIIRHNSLKISLTGKSWRTNRFIDLKKQLNWG